ncbi:MAG: hypothetical protein IPH84_11690 [Bacteroidales bacterium]|nr:hypothetical protein [Bacteroidales bacterium]
MKPYSSILFAGILLLLISNGFSGNTTEKSLVNSPVQPQLVIHCSPDLLPMMQTWVHSYAETNKAFTLQCREISGNGVLAADGLRFSSAKSAEKANNQNWQLKVGKDVVVGIIKASHPHAAIINSKGIKASQMAEWLNNPDARNWNTVDPQINSQGFELFYSGSQGILSTLNTFSGTTELLIMNRLETLEELLGKVGTNENAIGFCRLGDLLSLQKRAFPSSVMIVPIDKNNNGRLDNFERIYSDPVALLRGVWLGKYPSSLVEDFVITSDKLPADQSVIAFLQWVISDGQNLLNTNGYCELANVEKESGKTVLAGNLLVLNEPEQAVGMSLWIIVIFGVIIIGVLISLIAFRGKVQRGPLNTTPGKHYLINEDTATFPGGFYFDKTHTWVYMEQDGIVKVGIDDFLQHITGMLNKVTLLEVGTKVRKGEKLVTIINEGKQLNIYAPVSGVIKNRNPKLTVDSTLINSAPYSDGWIYQIEPLNWKRELDFMMMGNAYKEWVRTEFQRVRDFFAFSPVMRLDSAEPVMIQDGGELTDHPLSMLSPEVWEDFQTRFIDISR